MLENKMMRPVYATRTLDTLVGQFASFTSLLTKDYDPDMGDTKDFQLDSNEPVLKEFKLVVKGVELGYGSILGNKASSLIDEFAGSLCDKAKKLANTTGDLEDDIYTAKQSVLRDYDKLVDYFKSLDNLY